MKEWTIMFYFASDNPLASGIVSQLKAIKDAGFHQQANVIAYFDPQTKNTPSHVFDVNLIDKLRAGGRSRVGVTANDPFVRNLVLDKLWRREEDKNIRTLIREWLDEKQDHDDRGGNDRHIDLNEFDSRAMPSDLSGEPSPQAALHSFLDFCQGSYPARHYILFFIGHGQVVGNDMFLFDENTDEPKNLATGGGASTPNAGKAAQVRSITQLKPRQNSLTLKDLRTELETFKGKIEKTGQLELIGFHSCSMSGLELAYEIQGLANYMMASQGPSFVGSWPYKHILIRLFNDLNSSSFRPNDLETVLLASRLKKGDDPVCQYLNDHCFADTKTRALLDNHDESVPPSKKLLYALANKLNEKFLNDTYFHKSELVQQIDLANETRQLKDKDPQGTDLMWLNRMLLQDFFRAEIKNGETRKKPTVKEMLIKMFYFCLNNSYDYQLAGYSFDITLCDLSKLKDENKGIDAPLKRLSEALTQGLDDELVKTLILLAHLKSQSYFDEQYTDLYDFCFCLRERYQEAKKANLLADLESKSEQTLEKIIGVCNEVMEALKRGSEKDDDGLIVRCEYVGPEFQYSHGLSIFFPWSPPVDSFFKEQYPGYRLNTDHKYEPNWDKFLHAYFDQTRRKLHAAEGDERDKDNKANEGRLEGKLLGVLQAISDSISRNDGQLGHHGGIDPLGGACVCPSIKNFPTSGVPLSPNYAPVKRSKTGE